MATTTIQFSEFHDDGVDACKRFACGVLGRALRDLLADFDNKSGAREWLNGRDCAFPFWLVCKILDVHEDRLREQIKRQIERPTPELLSTLFAVPVGRVKQRLESGGIG